MRLINNTKAVFDVRINPWERLIELRHKASGEIHAYEYHELDEWFSWIPVNMIYDFHLLFEDETLDFSIYEVVSGMPGYSHSIPYNLDIVVGQ